MLIPVRELVNTLGIMPNGVLHVGAHLAEEAPEYENFRWVPVIWVESQQELVKEVRNKLDPSLHTVIEATVWDISNQKLVFKKTNSSQSSSLLNLGTHLSDYPDITVFPKSSSFILKSIDAMYTWIALRLRISIVFCKILDSTGR